MELSQFNFNTQLLLREMQARGILLEVIENTDLVIATLGDHKEYILNQLLSIIPATYQHIWDDKFYSKSVIAHHGISVAQGEVFYPNQYNEVLSYAEKITYPVVIKPTNASHGDLVFCKLMDEQSLVNAVQEFSIYSSIRNMLVEQYFPGTDYRFLKIKNCKEIYVIQRTPPQIIGDGASSIEDLILKENHRRQFPRTTCLCPIFIDDSEGKRMLLDQGVTKETILPKGKKLSLRRNANVSWGAECSSVSSGIHPSFYELIERIWHLFEKASYMSVDLLIKDIASSAEPDNYVIGEFNSCPGFSMHEMPGTGTPQLVVRHLVDLLFPETCIP